MVPDCDSHLRVRVRLRLERICLLEPNQIPQHEPHERIGVALERRCQSRGDEEPRRDWGHGLEAGGGGRADPHTNLCKRK